MADREGDDWASHEGGYKRPPPWGRFQKGHSGNPKGRPRAKDRKATANLPTELTEFEQLVSDLLGEKIMLTLGGSKVSVSKKRALLLNLFKQAMVGQPLAMRELNRIIEKVETKEEVRARADAEAAELEAWRKSQRDEAWFRHLSELKGKQVKAWMKAAADRRDEPDEPWPHPDDILIDQSNRTAKVRGPIRAVDVADWEYLRRTRDHYLARVVYHTSLEDRIHRLISQLWLVAMVECDLDLPRRWQISHNIGPSSIRLMAMGFPKLEALVEEGAKVFEAGSQRLSGGVYKEANRKWGPMIKILGFRSLRHLERRLG